ncbi:hypothetical protein Dimus_014724 [Dionaea muscipula]
MEYEVKAPPPHSPPPSPSNMTPLAAIVEAFEELAEMVDDSKEDLRLKAFSDACALVSVLFDSLGIAFKFAEIEYCSKVRNLAEASRKYATLQNVLEVDVKNDTVKCAGSLSRNLRRVRQGLDLIRALFHQFVSTNDYSLREAASTAYSQTCAPYHTWAVRAAVAAGMYALPTRDQLLLKLHETDQSAEKRMRRYMKASLPIIHYIDNLYTSRDISLDW